MNPDGAIDERTTTKGVFRDDQSEPRPPGRRSTAPDDPVLGRARKVEIRCSKLRYTDLARTQVFSVIAAREVGQGPELFLAESGSTLVELQLPLWPRVPAFAAPTTQLFTDGVRAATHR